MNRQAEVKQMNSKQLIEVATELKIVGRHDMRKQQLLDAVLKLIPDEIVTQETVEDKPRPKKDYVASLKGGEIVAFRLGEKKVISGMVMDVTDEATFSIQTKAGTLYSVKKSNVIWVKTGTKWPKWVFDQFGKGVSICQEKSQMQA